MQGLESFDVQKNDVLVSFAMASSAINLKSLVVSETKTKSLSGIGSASALTSLHITNAELTGSIPADLYSLSNLRDLYLSHNQLSGTISSNIGLLKRLQNLYMFDNGLNGFLPTELGYLAMLKALSLGENRFIGDIPRQITALPNLELLSLQKEQDPVCAGPFCVGGGGGLTGSVPALNSLTKIKEVYLAHNKFTGTVPSNFLQGVKDKSQQILADLRSYNNIEGTIPKELADFDDLQLLLAANSIISIPDELCEKEDWFNGEVGNGCDAILCNKGTFNEYGRRVDSSTPCEVCTYPGSSPSLGSTECGPVLVNETFNDRKILFELYDAAGGSNWKNKDGWLKESENECQWFGVKCEPVGKHGTMVVTELNLSDNNLDGIIPSLLYHMPDLRKLDVRNNAVQMHFYAIYRSTALEELWLDNTLVPSLNGIGRAKALTLLHLSDNSLGWQPIPDELYDVQTLTDLDLSNAMVGGTLSSKIGTMTNLKSLSLAGNAISGSIPEEIGLLEALEDLSLSNNDWIGVLPESLSSLAALKSFYLNNDDEERVGLSGQLLPFSTMPDLTELHLSDNQFTGTIPDDFLSGVNSDSVINVSLDKNSLVGTIPATLSALNKLNIHLTDNLITGIGDGLCTMSQWMGGSVGTYSCDAILCPPGQYSSIGRQESTETDCVPCPGDDNSELYGSSFCLSVEKQKEKEILEKLFDATGGSEWHNKDMWKDSAFDYCKWHGITCSTDAIVESIILGSNHLVGTVPSEIYQLAGLKNLWLYSNPVDLNFDGIAQATSLKSLILDSTKLTSVDGIGKASSLKDLDIRFNNLGGTLPAEIGQLTNLESLTCSENAFSGKVPEMTILRKLKTLRMSDNKFTGTLPSFSRHPVLESLDLSKNSLGGTIPNTLLGAADTSLTIYLDLSDNQLTGDIPSELSRFPDMTRLLLRQNKIEGIPPELCALESWNGGDVGNFGCDGILCPPGTVSAYGRASRKLDSECESCQSSHFGQTYCGSAADFGLKSILLLSLSAITITGLFL